MLSADGPENPTVRLVLVALLTFVNDTKGCAWPGVDKIQMRSGFKSVRTVQEALGEAEATGWLRRSASQGHVTLYYPAIEGQTIALTPAPRAEVTPAPSAETPALGAVTPAPNAGESCREPGRESKKEEGPAFTCPRCASPMEKKRPRRKEIPEFYGCTRYKADDCPGKRELDGTDSTPRAKAVTEAPSGPRVSPTRAEQERKARMEARALALADRMRVEAG